MKIATRILLGLIGLVVLAVIGLGAVIATIDPNDYRGQITAAVKDATGRDLTIKGDLALGISLIPTVVVNDVSFANASWGSRREMATLKRLEANLQIIPLLSGEVRIGHIVLVEPDILAEVAADGRANWEFAATKPSGPAPQDKKPDASGGPPTIPVIGSVSIDKGKLRYLDHKAKQDLTLALDRVRIDEVGDKFKIDLAGAYNAAQFHVKGTIDPLARLAADVDDYAIDLEATAFAASVRAKGTVGKMLSAPRLGIDVALSSKDPIATLKALKTIVPTLEIAGLPPLGALDASARATGPATSPGVENLKLTLGSGSDPLRIEATGKGANGTYTLDRLAANIKSSDIAGSLSAVTTGKVPQIKADLTSKSFDLADVLAMLPREDKPTQPAPASKGKGGAPVAAADGRVLPADPLPLDGLKAVNADVTLKMARFVAEGTQVTNLDAKAQLRDGKLMLDPFSAVVSEGKIGGRVFLDGAAPTPALETNIGIDKLNVGHLLKERGMTDMLTGKADAKINVRGTGNSVRAIMAGLTGTTEVTMQDGLIASQYVELLAADLTTSLLSGAKTTKLNCVVSRFDIKQGIATSTGLLLDTEKMTVSGSGTVDLRQERLNLTINPEPKEKSLLSLARPIDVGGTFAAPSVKPNMAGVAMDLGKLALMGLTPAGAVAALARTGTGEQNPCVAALDQKKAPAGAPPPQQQPSNNPVDSVTKGVQDTFRNLFGGSK